MKNIHSFSEVNISIYVNGPMVHNFTINATSGFPVGGNFILGQKVDDFTGIFETEESFSGEISSFNVWDSLLNESTINSIAICNSKTLFLNQLK